MDQPCNVYLAESKATKELRAINNNAELQLYCTLQRMQCVELARCVLAKTQGQAFRLRFGAQYSYRQYPYCLHAFSHADKATNITDNSATGYQR